VDFALIVEEHLLGERLVMHAADALEDVAERPVSQVVHQRRRKAEKLVFLGEVERAAELLDDPPRRLHHTKAMAVTRMIRPRICQRRHAELPDAAEALELDAVEQSEEEGIDGPVEPERDHVVNGIADDLLADRHRPACYGGGGSRSRESTTRESPGREPLERQPRRRT
jgi:hypothetical protein